MRARALLTAAALAALGTLVGPATPAQAASPLQFGKVYYDSPGSDGGSNTSLNAEYIVIKNVSTTTKTLSGWTVRDAANHVYTFGTFSLGAGKSVVLHTGKGTNSSGHRYWGKAWYVWNNTGDTARLRNKAGTLMDTCSWSSKGSGYKTC
jgi:hypothetical protein